MLSSTSSKVWRTRLLRQMLAGLIGMGMVSVALLAAVLWNRAPLEHALVDAAEQWGRRWNTNDQLSLCEKLLHDAAKRSHEPITTREGLRAIFPLVDSWGSPIDFRAQGAHAGRLCSAGPDQVLWTDDDLTKYVALTPAAD